MSLDYALDIKVIGVRIEVTLGYFAAAAMPSVFLYEDFLLDT